MKWKRVKSRDVIDIRGASKRGGGRSSGGGIPVPSGIAGMGGGAGLIVVIVIVAINAFSGSGGTSGLGLDSVFGNGTTAPGANKPSPIPADEDPDRDLKDFSTYVFQDAQQMWNGTFERAGDRYDKAQLVLFSGGVTTGGCGSASSAVGPFYCPADSRVYLDLSFYRDMERQLGAGGDFAWAYVIAHEMGHHIQNLTGVSDEVRSRGNTNDLSVRQELQADCYAGVWGSTVFERGDLEAGDLDEAFGAAEAVGDDRLQGRGGGSVNPDSFTHGSSEQRRRWFTTGYESGDPGRCDTFSVSSP